MSFKKIFGFCGACIAFYIGAGFATMQEVMQYEASYGTQFWIVIAVAALIYIYTNISFVCNGHRKKIKNGADIYDVYCGKTIGVLYKYFSAVFCYMSFVVMCGGANSTAMEQWGFTNGFGAILLSVLVIGTVIFGLTGIVKTLGVLGPVIIILIIGVALMSVFKGWDYFSTGLDMINEHRFNITQVGNGNPLASGASYGGFVILWFASFLGGIGARHNVGEVNLGMLLSTFLIFGVASLCCVALIANIEQTWNAGVPALVLAKNINPVLAQLFSIIIFVGIYTSACPLLWTSIGKIAVERTPKYRCFVLIGGVLGCLIACFVPYRPLLNIIYGINGYLGFVLIIFMLVNDLKALIKNTNNNHQ